MSPQRNQRSGRALTWVVGTLFLVYLLLTAYEYWINRDRQDQDDDEIARLKKEAFDTQPSHPEDWPQWRGPLRDGTAPGDNLLADWPKDGPPELWRVKAGPGFSSLAVANGRIVTMFQDGDNEVVGCWNAEDGKELWRHSYRARFTREGVGPRSTPCIAGDEVYTVGALGDLFCLKLRNGKPSWHRDLRADFGGDVPRWGFAFSPLVVGDLLITFPGGPDNASIVAFDRKQGTVKWRAGKDLPGYSSPVLCTIHGEAQLMCLTGTTLNGIALNGTLLWSFPWKTADQANAATPILRGDYIFISSGYNQGCAVVRIVKENGVFSARQVYANNLMRNHFSTCIFFRDHLYGFDEAYLVCMPFREGQRRSWKERRFHRGSVLLAGERLIVLGENGRLALVEPTPEEYREIASCEVSKHRCWAMPALARGRLYIRDDAVLFCLDLRK